MPQFIDPAIERDFLSALDRLKAGVPTNADLAALPRNELSISKSTVAKEAGHTRRLIASKDSPYKRVREAIEAEVKAHKSQRPTPRKSKSSYGLVIQLREDKRRLLEENRILATRLMDALTIARRALEHAPDASGADVVARMRAMSNRGRKGGANRTRRSA